MKTGLDSRPPFLFAVGSVLFCLYLPACVFVAPVLGNRPTIDWDLNGLLLLGVSPGLWFTIPDKDAFVMAGVVTALLGSYAVWIARRTWFSLAITSGTLLGWSAFSTHWLSGLLWRVH